jgi:hypothetical protein
MVMTLDAPVLSISISSAAAMDTEAASRAHKSQVFIDFPRKWIERRTLD